MEKITNPDILKRQAETRERFKAARAQLEQAKAAELTDEDRQIIDRAANLAPSANEENEGE